MQFGIDKDDFIAPLNIPSKMFLALDSLDIKQKIDNEKVQNLSSHIRHSNGTIKFEYTSFKLSDNFLIFTVEYYRHYISTPSNALIEILQISD
jgi:hypothetical protein